MEGRREGQGDKAMGSAGLCLLHAERGVREAAPLLPLPLLLLQRFRQVVLEFHDPSQGRLLLRKQQLA